MFSTYIVVALATMLFLAANTPGSSLLHSALTSAQAIKRPPTNMHSPFIQLKAPAEQSCLHWGAAACTTMQLLHALRFSPGLCAAPSSNGGLVTQQVLPQSFPDPYGLGAYVAAFPFYPLNAVVTIACCCSPFV